MKFHVRFTAAFLIAGMGVSAWADTKLNLGHTGSPEFLASFVAKEQGFFAKRGLDVEITQIATANALAALAGNTLQVVTTTPTSLLLAAEGGLDIRIVAGTTEISHKVQNIAVLIKAGSPMKDPKQLAGGKIGIPSIGGIFQVMARHWLRKVGLDPKVVTFIEVPLPQMNDALRGGSVDAVVSTDPFLIRSEKSGAANVLAYLTPELPEGASGAMYVSTADWIHSNPAAARGFQDAIMEAVEYVRKNPQSALPIASKYTKVPVDVLEGMRFNPLSPRVTESQLRFLDRYDEGPGNAEVGTEFESDVDIQITAKPTFSKSGQMAPSFRTGNPIGQQSGNLKKSNLAVGPCPQPRHGGDIDVDS